jgi:hypothetical protein
MARFRRLHRAWKANGIAFFRTTWPMSKDGRFAHHTVPPPACDRVRFHECPNARARKRELTGTKRSGRWIPARGKAGAASTTPLRVLPRIARPAIDLAAASFPSLRVRRGGDSRAPSFKTGREGPP